MSEAVGIHAHPTKKLGARPEDTSRPKVAIGEFLLRSPGAPMPVYPAQDTPPELTYPMDHNDAAGDCVVAGVDHALQVINTLLTGGYVNWRDDFLLMAYQSQNPGFKSWADAGGSSDNGMVVAEFLDWCIKQKLILAYGKIDHTNQAEVEAAIYVGLAIITAESLQEAQQSGKTWDYVAGSPDWGGHCTVWNGYKPWKTVTWGEDDYFMTDGFVQHRMSEAYFILTQAHIDHPSFRDNFDLAGFAAAVSAITHGKVVVSVPPAPGPNPTPTPTPTPTPEAAPFPGATDAVASHIMATATKEELSVTDYQNKIWSSHFRIKG